MVYYGYVLIPHETYLAWKNATLNNGYDFDYSYGCQCYDLAVEFYWNVGFPQGYPVSGVPGQGNTGNAYDIWTYRQYNVAYNGTTYFDLIYNLNDVKQGDMMIYSGSSVNPFGHVGFADQDYATWNPPPLQPYEFPILSQNNGGSPTAGGGTTVNVHGYDTRLFLGAFRYREWSHPSPTPTIQRKPKPHHFPWVLYARKFRNGRR